jgi:hypothetical protein
VRHPHVAPLLFGIPMMLIGLSVLLALFRLAEKTWNPPPYYSDHVGSIRVLESRFNWVDTKDGVRIFITGLATNQSPIAWKSLEFECRFFDANGTMIDGCNSHASLTIQPSTESAFRVIVKPVQAAATYKTHRIAVTTAQNIKSLF